MKREYVALFSAISTSEKLADLPDDAARLFFTWILAQCDAHGRITASARKLNALVWPLLSKSTEETEQARNACVRKRLLHLHRQGDLEWIQVPDWPEKAGRFVRAGRVGESEFPNPPDHSGSDPGPIQPRGEEKREEETRGEAPPRVARQPSGRVQEIIAAWIDEFRHATGETYVMHAGDGPAVAKLVKTAPHVTAQDAQERARTLLAAQSAFWLTNRNLRTLATRWSDVGSIPAEDAARDRAKAPPKSFAQESFENLVNTSPIHNPQGFADAARSIARPARQPLGTPAGRVAQLPAPSSELRALPGKAGERTD